jgi:hypothetical protein
MLRQVRTPRCCCGICLCNTGDQTTATYVEAAPCGRISFPKSEHAAYFDGTEGSRVHYHRQGVFGSVEHSHRDVLAMLHHVQGPGRLGARPIPGPWLVPISGGTVAKRVAFDPAYAVPDGGANSMPGMGMPDMRMGG